MNHLELKAQPFSSRYLADVSKCFSYFEHKVIKDSDNSGNNTDNSYNNWNNNANYSWVFRLWDIILSV